MITNWLRVRARFAGFRCFQAGVYRASAPVIPPSSAYGLLMNIAKIDIRDYSNPVTTQIRSDVPLVQIAIGLVSPECPETGLRIIPESATLYQQLHSYPVGNSGQKTLKPKAKGAKYWIVPVKRELIVGFDAIIGIRTEDVSLLDLIRDGLNGVSSTPRYGLPFLGDNNFLIDRLDWQEAPPNDSIWYVPMKLEDGPKKGSCRLTVGIDRTDNSKTTSGLYAPAERVESVPPEEAWTWTPHAN